MWHFANNECSYTSYTHAYLSTLYIVYALLDQLSTFYLALTFSMKLDPENTPASGATPQTGVKTLCTISPSDHCVARKMSNERRHELKYYLHSEE